MVTTFPPEQDDAGVTPEPGTDDPTALVTSVAPVTSESVQDAPAALLVEGENPEAIIKVDQAPPERPLRVRLEHGGEVAWWGGTARLAEEHPDAEILRYEDGEPYGNGDTATTLAP